MADKTYFAVIYYDNGEALVHKFHSEEELIEGMKKGVMKHPEHVIGTTYITRQGDVTVQDVFGTPKSRDIMQDKKFLNELRGN